MPLGSSWTNHGRLDSTFSQTLRKMTEKWGAENLHSRSGKGRSTGVWISGKCGFEAENGCFAPRWTDFDTLTDGFLVGKEPFIEGQWTVHRDAGNRPLETGKCQKITTH